MTINWTMADAGNDWWWAIDNIVVTGVTVPSAVGSAGKLGTQWGRLKRR